MTDAVEIYDLAQPASFHPRPFDVVAAKSNTYGGRFAKDFQTRMVRLEQLAVAICRQVWSPIVFLGGHRVTTKFVEAAWMALDFDSPDYTLAAALREWADSVHIIGVTRNHQIDKDGTGRKFDRFRLIVPWEEPITDVKVYAHNMQRLIDRYGADVKCKDGARLFYPCAAIVSVNRGGYLQPVLQPPPEKERVAPAIYREQGIVRRRTLLALSAPFPEGEKNDACFNCAKDLHDAGYDADAIYKIIVGSPTYQGTVSVELSDEIRSCIRNGIKSVKQGKAYGRRQGSGAGASKAREEKGAETVGAVLPAHPENEPPSPCP